jgi:hypothetical protein
LRIWERQENESDKEYKAFQKYLDMPERSLPKLAESLSRTRQSIQDWAFKYKWRERAIAYDNSIREDIRRETARAMTRELKKQWDFSVKMLDKLRLVFEEKELAKVSWKSWNEMYEAGRRSQYEITERQGIKPAEDESEITVNIVTAQKSKADEADGD